METEIFINSEVTSELKKYGKYIKYTRDGLIKHQNYNWLVLDSSYNSYKKLQLKLMEYNIVADIQTKVLTEVDYTNRRGMFMVDELKSAIENQVDVNQNNPRGIYSGIVRMKKQCNIIVLGSITDEGTALQEYGEYCTFFVDLNSIPVENEKDINIDQFIKENHFFVSDEVRKELTNLDQKNYERLITRGFISALNDGQRKVLCRTDVFPTCDNTATEVLAELDGLVGLQEVKTEIKQIYNYLLIAKQRKSNVCTNMLFLGNPRNW